MADFDTMLGELMVDIDGDGIAESPASNVSPWDLSPIDLKGIGNAMMSAIRAPSDAYQGRIPANEMLTRAMGAAGLVSPGMIGRGMGTSMEGRVAGALMNADAMPTPVGPPNAFYGPRATPPQVYKTPPYTPQAMRDIPRGEPPVPPISSRQAHGEHAGGMYYHVDRFDRQNPNVLLMENIRTNSGGSLIDGRTGRFVRDADGFAMGEYNSLTRERIGELEARPNPPAYWQRQLTLERRRLYGDDVAPPQTRPPRNGQNRPAR